MQDWKQPSRSPAGLRGEIGVYVESDSATGG